MYSWAVDSWMFMLKHTAHLVVVIYPSHLGLGDQGVTATRPTPRSLPPLPPQLRVAPGKALAVTDAAGPLPLDVDLFPSYDSIKLRGFGGAAPPVSRKGSIRRRRRSRQYCSLVGGLAFVVCGVLGV
jgi:hypothetical protein